MSYRNILILLLEEARLYLVEFNWQICMFLTTLNSWDIFFPVASILKNTLDTVLSCLLPLGKFHSFYFIFLSLNSVFSFSLSPLKNENKFFSNTINLNHSFPSLYSSHPPTLFFPSPLHFFLERNIPPSNNNQTEKNQDTIRQRQSPCIKNGHDNSIGGKVLCDILFVF